MLLFSVAIRSNFINDGIRLLLELAIDYHHFRLMWHCVEAQEAIERFCHARRFVYDSEPITAGSGLARPGGAAEGRPRDLGLRTSLR